MKKNILKIIVFVLISICLAFFIDRSLMKMFYQVNSEEVGVWNDVLAGKVNADIIISGDSRALTSFDCQTISQHMRMSCYNMSVNGNLIDIQMARFKLYMKNNKKPKIFVQVLGRSTLGQSVPFDPVQFVPYLWEPDVYAALMKTKSKEIFIKAKYIPLYGIAALRIKRSLNIFDDLFKSALYDTRVNGFLPVYTKWNLNAQQFKAIYVKGLSGTINPEGVETLSSMMKYCREQAIPFVIVVSPMYVEGREIFKNKEEMLGRYEQIASEQGVYYLNYFDHEMTNVKDNFYNYQHTNVLGAKVISEIFSKDLKNMVVK